MAAVGAEAEAVAAAGTARIAAAFAAARAEDRAALMPYMMGGFPDREAARRIGAAYVEAGADLIELGVPFSDPLADGPVIHAAATAALAAGATLGSVLDLCAELAPRLPIVVMCYANMALAPGGEVFAERLAAAGACGAIVPDLPPEEAEPLRAPLAAAGLALVPLVAPTTPPERRRGICAQASGFVYVVSVTGVTGERGALPELLTTLAAAVREEAPVPAAVGFGIATPAQAAAVGAIADGVIIGSRLVREATESDDPPAAIGRFLKEVRAALGA